MSEFDEVRVVDEQGADVPDGEEGELLVRGPYTIRGYYGSPQADAALQPPAVAVPVVVLSGPEGGLSPAEEAAARSAGFVGVQLGPRVLRAETAPLAVLAWLGLHLG